MTEEGKKKTTEEGRKDNPLFQSRLDPTPVSESDVPKLPANSGRGNRSAALFESSRSRSLEESTTDVIDSLLKEKKQVEFTPCQSTEKKKNVPKKKEAPKKEDGPKKEDMTQLPRPVLPTLRAEPKEYAKVSFRVSSLNPQSRDLRASKHGGRESPLRKSFLTGLPAGVFGSYTPPQPTQSCEDPLQQAQAEENPVAPAKEGEKKKLEKSLEESDGLALSLSSSISEYMYPEDVPVMVDKKDIELLPTTTTEDSSSSVPDAERVIDLEELAYLYERVVFDIRKVKNVTSQNRILAYNIVESRNTLKKYLFAAMKALNFYKYPLVRLNKDREEAGQPKILEDSEMKLLFDGVEDIFFGMLRIMEYLRKSGTSFYLLDKRDDGFEMAVCGAVRLMDGYVQFAKYYSRRSELITSIMNVKDQRYFDAKDLFDRTRIVCGETLCNMVDMLIQNLPKFGPSFGNIVKLCLELDYSQLKVSYDNIVKFHKAILDQANLEKEAASVQAAAHYLEGRLIKTLMSKQVDGQKEKIQLVRELTNKHIAVGVLQDEERSGFIFLLYQDALLLLNNSGGRMGDLGLRITRRFDFYNVSLSEHPFMPAVHIVDSLLKTDDNVVVMSDSFLALIMKTYKDFRASLSSNRP